MSNNGRNPAQTVIAIALVIAVVLLGYLAWVQSHPVEVQQADQKRLDEQKDKEETEAAEEREKAREEATEQEQERIEDTASKYDKEYRPLLDSYTQVWNWLEEHGVDRSEVQVSVEYMSEYYQNGGGNLWSDAEQYATYRLSFRDANGQDDAMMVSFAKNPAYEGMGRFPQVVTLPPTETLRKIAVVLDQQ